MWSYGQIGAICPTDHGDTREYGSMFDLILARGWQAIHSLHATASAIHSSTRPRR